MAVSLLMRLLIIHLPPLADAFRLVPLGWQEWAILIPLSFIAMTVNEIWMHVFVRRDDQG